MNGLILALSLAFIVYLLLENIMAVRRRNKIRHVIHVNGTRGKSSVTRLITAGLQAGGLKAMGKVTGTVPLLIDPDSQEREIRRRSPANIKEQLWVLHRAVDCGADYLVVECMALDPAYQRVSQQRMLRADIGVITNVRLDHTEIMGEIHEQIALALSHTIPRNGLLFTTEQHCYPLLQDQAQIRGSQTIQVGPAGDAFETDVFAENLALALAVCEHLGVERQTALRGMRQARRDTYALALYRIGQGALFLNGLSINDPQSTVMAYREIARRPEVAGRQLLLLLNNRADRAQRACQLAAVVSELMPRQVWVCGSGAALLARQIRRQTKPHTPPVLRVKGSYDELAALDDRFIIFAAGNIAGPGKLLLDEIISKGKPYVL